MPRVKAKVSWKHEIIEGELLEMHGGYVVKQDDGVITSIAFEEIIESEGLYKRYNVTRTDGSSEPGKKHEKCRYFVIDMNHDEFAEDALNAYADACEAKYPELAKSIREDLKRHDWILRI